MYKSIREIRRWFPNKIKSQEKNNNNKRILSLSISFFFFSYCCCCYCGCYVSDHRAMVLAGWEREKKESRELHRLLLSYCWLLKNVNLDEQDLSSSKVPMHKSTKVFLSLYRSFTLIESTSSSTQHPTIQTIQTWNFVACPPPLSSSSSCFGYSMRRVGWCPSRILSRAFIFFIFFFLKIPIGFFFVFVFRRDEDPFTVGKTENIFLSFSIAFFFLFFFLIRQSHTHTIKKQKQNPKYQTTSWPVKRSSHWAVIIMDGWPIYSIISNPSYRIQVLHHLTVGPRSGGSIDIFWTADRHTEREMKERHAKRGIQSFVRLIQ